MKASTHIRRKLLTLALAGGLAAMVVPPAQGHDRNWVADSVESARVAQERKSPIGQPGYGRDRIADSVESARDGQRRRSPMGQQRRRSPMGQPGYGRDRVADSVDTALAAKKR